MESAIKLEDPLMGVLMLLSVYGLALVIERLFYFRRSKLNVRDLLCGLSNLVKRGKFAEALHEASRAPGPVARVAEAALARHDLERDRLKEVVQEAGQLQVPALERNIRGLLVVAIAAPMIGVLGSFLGLIDYFLNPDAVSEISNVVVRDPVFQSLVTSSVALAIAIPAYLFYMFLASRARRGIRDIERGGIEMVNLLCDARDGKLAASIASPTATDRCAANQEEGE